MIKHRPCMARDDVNGEWVRADHAQRLIEIEVRRADKANTVLDATRNALALAGQSIVEAHGEDSVAYSAIESVGKVLKKGDIYEP